MECSGTQHIEAPSSDTTIIDDFISIRDILKDSHLYFQNRIDEKFEAINGGDYNQLEYLYEGTKNALKSIDEIINKLCMDKPQRMFGNSPNDIHGPIGGSGEAREQIENTSYLDMSRKKYESIDMTKNITENINRHDYVDVVSKPMMAEFNDDDNIYDNYVVERNHTTTTTATVTAAEKLETKEEMTDGQKVDCPFNGLPAAHLTIMHSPKVGWLTMHLRGKRYIHHFSVHFKRKYYTGLVMKQTKNPQCEWWLLMYTSGTSDLKPSVCLPLNRFAVHANHLTNTNGGSQRRQHCENKSNPCKFELNEKSNRKNKKSYCFVADTPENCEHWVNLLKQLCIGLPYVESTFLMTAQIRKLPMLPLNAKNLDIDRQAIGTDIIDTNDNSQKQIDSDDICNHSEGVYEEPEDYYRNVQKHSSTTTTTPPTATTKLPILPQKKFSQPTTTKMIRMDNVHTPEIYDTPRKPMRKTDENYDQISLENRSPMLGRRNVIDNDEMCTKQSSMKLNDNQSQMSGRLANDEEIPVGKYHHMSTVRKWLFSNHFSKLRQSSNSTNSERTSSDDGTTEQPTVSSNTQHHTQRNKKATTTIVRPTDGQRRTFSVQPTKFNKVHMIINQLEANGQLTLISGGTSTKV